MNKFFISAAATAAAFFASVDTAPAQVVQIVDLVVESVEFQEGELVALAEVTLDIAGEIVTQNIEIPLTLDGEDGGEGECDILNLAVGPVDLDLLGLVVELDDCNDGPVTVDIVALEGGGLLGDLLCEVAGLLDGGLSLGDLLDLGLLDEVGLDVLTGAIRDVLNEVFAELLDGGEGVAASSHQPQHQQQGGGGNRCDILTLEIPDGLSLEVLGLLVDTSGICLDVYAERGDGNLLGNLLCAVTNLLNGNANQNAVNALLRNIVRLIERLDL